MIYSQEIRFQSSTYYLAGRSIFPRIMADSEKEIFSSCPNNCYPALTAIRFWCTYGGMPSLRNQRRGKAAPQFHEEAFAAAHTALAWS